MNCNKFSGLVGCFSSDGALYTHLSLFLRKRERYIYIKNRSDGKKN
jgi:hypothetical protein